VLNKFLPRYRTVEILSASVKYLPAFEVCLNKGNKFGNQGKSHFSQSSAIEAAENAWTVIVWPCNYKFILHAARSPTDNKNE